MIFSDLTPGKTVEGQDIHAYRSQSKGQKYLYVMAGVHGDEVEGVYVLKELFQWLRNENDLPEIPMIVIPIVNLDGYRAGTRVNAHLVDLNRNCPTDDWTKEVKSPKYYPGSAPLSEPENQFLFKLFGKYEPGFILSFHSWKPILNFNGNCLDIAEFIHGYNKYPLQDDIGYPTPGSLGTCGPQKLNAPVLTYECPTLTDSGMTLKEIWEENEKGLKAIFKSDLLTKKIQH